RHGVPEDRLRLLPLFPAGQRPDSEPPEARAPEGRTLFLGRLTALKGGQLLVRALRRARAVSSLPLTLTVAGDGPERRLLELAAAESGVPAECVGWVDGPPRERLLRSADLLVVPSTWPEPFGLVGLEAGCVGLPSVGFSVGGVPDWLLPEESGVLASG